MTEPTAHFSCLQVLEPVLVSVADLDCYQKEVVLTCLKELHLSSTVVDCHCCWKEVDLTEPKAQHLLLELLPEADLDCC